MIFESFFDPLFTATRENSGFTVGRVTFSQPYRYPEETWEDYWRRVTDPERKRKTKEAAEDFFDAVKKSAISRSNDLQVIVTERVAQSSDRTDCSPASSHGVQLTCVAGSGYGDRPKFEVSSSGSSITVRLTGPEYLTGANHEWRPVGGRLIDPASVRAIQQGSVLIVTADYEIKSVSVPIEQK